MLTASPATRTYALTAALLPQLLDAPVQPLAWLSGAPARTALRLRLADCDLYRPAAGGVHGAVVLTLGVHPLDKREPVVVRLAEGLSRTGLFVMVVQSDDLIADRILPSEPANLVAAFERLSAESAVDRSRIGLIGFSAGASLAFLAATDPAIADRVRLVSWLGGYTDATRLVEEVQSESYAGVPWQPHPLSRDVFRKQLTDDLGESHPTVQRLFAAREPAAVAQAAAELPAATRERLRAVSPIAAVERFRSRAYVLVDRADPLVPYTHSRELAQALPAERLARYVEFDLFDHVQPTKPLPPLLFLTETWRLYSTIVAILLDLDPAAS